MTRISRRVPNHCVTSGIMLLLFLTAALPARADDCAELETAVTSLQSLSEQTSLAWEEADRANDAAIKEDYDAGFELQVRELEVNRLQTELSNWQTKGYGSKTQKEGDLRLAQQALDAARTRQQKAANEKKAASENLQISYNLKIAAQNDLEKARERLEACREAAKKTPPPPPVDQSKKEPEPNPPMPAGVTEVFPPPPKVDPPVGPPPPYVPPPLGPPPPYVPPAVTSAPPTSVPPSSASGGSLTCYYTGAGGQKASFTTTDPELIKTGCPPQIFPGLKLVPPAAGGGSGSGGSGSGSAGLGPLTPLSPPLLTPPPSLGSGGDPLPPVDITSLLGGTITAPPSGLGRGPGPGRGQPGGGRSGGPQPGSGTGSGTQPGSGSGTGTQPGSGTGSGTQPGSGAGGGSQPVGQKPPVPTPAPPSDLTCLYNAGTLFAYWLKGVRHEASPANPGPCPGHKDTQHADVAPLAPLTIPQPSVPPAMSHLPVVPQTIPTSRIPPSSMPHRPVGPLGAPPSSGSGTHSASLPSSIPHRPVGPLSVPPSGSGTHSASLPPISGHGKIGTPSHRLPAPVSHGGLPRVGGRSTPAGSHAGKQRLGSLQHSPGGLGRSVSSQHRQSRRAAGATRHFGGRGLSGAHSSRITRTTGSRGGRGFRKR
jgi:hypothetical protein